jgi:hypothetical protein
MGRRPFAVSLGGSVQGYRQAATLPPIRRASPTGNQANARTLAYPSRLRQALRTPNEEESGCGGNSAMENLWDSSRAVQRVWDRFVGGFGLGVIRWRCGRVEDAGGGA